MSKRNYIKEAEQNVVNVARAYQDFLDVLDALAVFGNNYCNEYIGGKKFFEGLAMMREAAYHEYTNASMNAMMFTGVGGEEATKYAREKFERAFGKRDGIKYSVMQFLDQYGRHPGSYMTNDEEEFRKQVDEKLKE